jgi:hypothetical protein
MLHDEINMTMEPSKSLPIRTAERRARPSHPGRVRRILGYFRAVPSAVVDRVESFAMLLQKSVNTLRFEDFWRERVQTIRG